MAILQHIVNKRIESILPGKTGVGIALARGTMTVNAVKQTSIQQQTTNRFGNNMKTIIKQLGVAVAIIGATSAYAVPTAAVRYSTDGATWTTVADNSAGDLGLTSTIDGQMNVQVLLGSWSLQIVATLSKPVVGSAAVPIMDISVTGSTRGTESTPLWIEFSDVGFTPVPVGASFFSSVGGNLGGGNSEVYSTRASNANDLFGSGIALSSLAATGTPFDESATALAAGLAAPYSLTLSHVFTSGGAGVISTDGKLASVPDGGSSLLLLGLGLLGLAGIRRKA